MSTFWISQILFVSPEEITNLFEKLKKNMIWQYR
jgi:hypothetical protein